MGSCLPFSLIGGIGSELEQPRHTTRIGLQLKYYDDVVLLNLNCLDILVNTEHFCEFYS